MGDPTFIFIALTDPRPGRNHICINKSQVLWRENCFHTLSEKKSYETECTLADSPYSLVTIRYMLYEQWDQYIYLMAAMNRGSSLMAVRFTFCHCNEIYLAVMWSWGSVATRWPWRTTGCRVGWAVWALFVFEEGANSIKILITHCTSAIKSWLILNDGRLTNVPLPNSWR